MHDITSNIGILQLLPPQTIQAAALDSGDIDLQGAESLAIAILVGNIADGLSGAARIDVKIEHAEDDGSGAPGPYAACTDEDVLNFANLDAGTFLVIDAPAQENRRHVIGYRGGRRFVKVTATPVGLATGGPVAMIGLKANAAQNPVSNS